MAPPSGESSVVSSDTVITVIFLSEVSMAVMVVRGAMPGPDTVAPTASLSVLLKEICLLPLAKVPVSGNEPLEFTMAVNGAAFRANSWFFCESWGVTESVSATLLRGKISDDHHLLDCGTW